MNLNKTQKNILYAGLGLAGAGAAYYYISGSGGSYKLRFDFVANYTKNLKTPDNDNAPKLANFRTELIDGPDGTEPASLAKLKQLAPKGKLFKVFGPDGNKVGEAKVKNVFSKKRGGKKHLMVQLAMPFSKGQKADPSAGFDPYLQPA